MLDLESLFSLSYGMCIVSSGSSDKFSGCIVNTVAQITPQPPMLIISLNKKSLTNSYILDSGIFAVSILAESMPLELIRKFGFRTGRDFDKFEGISYKLGSLGVPIVTDDTTGFIEVEVEHKIDIETHSLFIGKIIACETIDSEKTPMTYSCYRGIKGGKTPKSAATYIEKKTNNESIEGAKTMKKYECLMCSYIYDPAVGDTIGGIEPGTAFEDLPQTWACPECGAGKDDFKILE